MKEAGWSIQAALEKWIDTGKLFALSLPEKKSRVQQKLYSKIEVESDARRPFAVFPVMINSAIEARRSCAKNTPGNNLKCSTREQSKKESSGAVKDRNVD